MWRWSIECGESLIKEETSPPKAMNTSLPRRLASSELAVAYWAFAVVAVLLAILYVRTIFVDREQARKQAHDESLKYYMITASYGMAHLVHGHPAFAKEHSGRWLTFCDFLGVLSEHERKLCHVEQIRFHELNDVAILISMDPVNTKVKCIIPDCPFCVR